MIDITTVPVVYLAGGMKSNWQDQVKQAVPGVIFIDPREHGQRDEHAYTTWDLAGVDRADVVFGFMETDNPGGAGLAVEFGFGAKAGKTLLLIEQDSYAQQKYFGMVRSLAHARFTGATGLERAIALLKQIRDRGNRAALRHHAIADAPPSAQRTLDELRQLPLAELRIVFPGLSAKSRGELALAATQELARQVRDFPEVRLGDLAICGFPETLVHTFAPKHPNAGQ